ncbi:SAM-dependent methyltransferase [Desulfobulbus alkaliphilus]|uniref:SAM-dependent methyltransferase n=1 Tax=Desulfobulbus alkaliphilus TaxID=869814 RepID=UPI00196355C5|nr:RlmE family RNA methyltransferase [Desulfobulbus alkaliphilus]MBM9536040.1 RlmE family RNA methyltransferase [Desulfobulbus alkaliphilus]
MRKEQDYYFHKAKKEKYPARSVFKLEEAQLKHRFLKFGQRVLDLGCHPGSWSLYAAEVIGEKGVVVGVDLQHTDLAVQKPHAEIHWLCYDVYSEDLVVYLKQNWPGFHVVLSDMAPRTTGSQYADHQHSLRLAERVLQMARLFLHKNGTVYCKVFQGEDFPQFLKKCRALFTSVKVVKPRSSRQESREVFLLGRGFHPQR